MNKDEILLTYLSHEKPPHITVSGDSPEKPDSPPSHSAQYECMFISPLWGVWEPLTAATAALCQAGSSVWPRHFSPLGRHHRGRLDNVCVAWKAHLADRETCNPAPLPVDLKPPPIPLSLATIPPSSQLSAPSPEGRDGYVSGVGDVTLSNLRFWQTNELKDLCYFVYDACRLWHIIKRTWSCFCTQVRHCTVCLILISLFFFYHRFCFEMHTIVEV